MSTETTEKPCRYCKTKIPTNLRRCPYCGILNPTLEIRSIFWTIAGVLAVMYVVSLFIG